MSRRRLTAEQILQNTLRGIDDQHSDKGSVSSKLLSNFIGRKRSRMSSEPVAVAHPSSSILLVNSENQILLLQRVNTSSSFPSAWVFPGGHVDAQDGELPRLGDPSRHEDSEAYRLAGIRECFEESGLLLAHDRSTRSRLVDLDEATRNEARKRIHAQEISFSDWLDSIDAVADTASLMPFTRWLTPRKIPKRFSTQMYLYFLPHESPSMSPNVHCGGKLHVPTPDGGVEHTAAQFLYAQEWLDMALQKEVVLFPPQFFLLALLAPFMPRGPSVSASAHSETLEQQRAALRRWVETDGTPSWSQKCMSPEVLLKETDQYMIMSLSEPGPELEGTSRRGDSERVLKIRLDKATERGRQRPLPEAVCWRKDYVEESEVVTDLDRPKI